LIQVYRLPVGQAVWVVQIGFEYTPASELSRHYSASIVSHGFKLEEVSFVEMRVP
jgi:hypothetical protein